MKSNEARLAATFDTAAFFAALDTHKTRQGMTWKEVAELVGVNSSTFTRMRQGGSPSASILAALLVWSGLNFNKFVKVAGKR